MMMKSITIRPTSPPTPCFQASFEDLKKAMAGAAVPFKTATPDIQTYYREMLDTDDVLSRPVLMLAGKPVTGIEVLDLYDQTIRHQWFPNRFSWSHILLCSGAALVSLGTVIGHDDFRRDFKTATSSHLKEKTLAKFLGAFSKCPPDNRFTPEVLMESLVAKGMLVTYHNRRYCLSRDGKALLALYRTRQKS